MALALKQIEERTDIIYRKFRDSHINRKDALLVRGFVDDLMDDLKYCDQRLGKKDKKDKEVETEADNDTSNQIKMIKSLRMNNPLWDVE